MGFSFKTRRRWTHNVPVACKATLNFTTTQSGRQQVQITMEDNDGNKQFSWTSLESERAEGILSNRLRPFLNVVCGLSMTPETIIDRNDILAQLQETNEEGETLQSLLEGRTIPMSVVTSVAPRDNGQTRVRVVSFLTPEERSEEGAMKEAKNLNDSASNAKNAESQSEQASDAF